MNIQNFAMLLIFMLVTMTVSAQDQPQSQPLPQTPPSNRPSVFGSGSPYNPNTAMPGTSAPNTKPEPIVDVNGNLKILKPGETLPNSQNTPPAHQQQPQQPPADSTGVLHR